jgi:hypothetical protein
MENSLVQYITFDVAGAPVQSACLHVFYGSAVSPRRYTCVVDSSQSTSTSLTCLTEANSQGIGLRIVVESVALVLSSNDTLSYAPAPSLTMVRGCPLVDGAGTAGCPTLGNIKIHLTGKNFLVRSFALVSHPVLVAFIWATRPLARIPSRSLSAELPVPRSTSRTPTRPSAACYLLEPEPAPRSSFPVAINCRSRLACSPTRRRRSHASRARPAPAPAPLFPLSTVLGWEVLWSPSSEKVLACSSASVFFVNFVFSCSDFGKSGAVVFIGNEVCQNTTHLQDAAHFLTCVLAPGTLLQRPVLVLQHNGLLSTSPSTLSYKQCPFGTYENGVLCSNCTGSLPVLSARAFIPRCVCVCAGGRYSNVLSSPYCPDCPLGFVSNTGTSACVACGVGTVSGIRGTVCGPCPPGFAAPTAQRANCDKCDPGRGPPLRVCGHLLLRVPFNTLLVWNGAGRFSVGGHAQCLPCDAGSYQDQPGQSACQQCAIGYYAPVPGLAACRPCDAGTLSSVLGAINCDNCSPGKFQSATARSNCSVSYGPVRFGWCS